MLDLRRCIKCLRNGDNAPREFFVKGEYMGEQGLLCINCYHMTLPCKHCGNIIGDHWKRVGSNNVLSTSCATPMWEEEVKT